MASGEPSRDRHTSHKRSLVDGLTMADLKVNACDLGPWIADAIEPVMSPHESSFWTAGDSTSIDGDGDGDGDSSSQSSHSRIGLGLGRFRSIRSIRVSLRRRKSRHRVLLSSVAHLTSQHHHHQHHQYPHCQTHHFRARRSSAIHQRITTTTMMHRRSDWRLSTDGEPSSMASTVPWSDVSNSHSMDLSELAVDRPSAEEEEDPCESSSSCVPESKRRRAWKKLTGVKLRMKRTKKAMVMYSITFYPWKMEAHGYYSNPEAAAEWVPDTASSRCQICLAAFNLARRRHHCRLCGHLVCNDCSLQRTFLPFSEDAHRRSNHSLIKSGEAQRTCNSCAKTLKNMAAQQDHRVKEFSIDVASPSATTTRASEGAGSQNNNRASQRPSSASVSASASSRSSLSKSGTGGGGRSTSATDLVVPCSDLQQLQVIRPRAISKTTMARHEELEQVLVARAKSRTVSGQNKQPQHIISSQWLGQWLQFVQAESSDAANQQQQQSYGYGRASTTSRASMGGSRTRRTGRYACGRRPGPIANYALLNFVNGKLVPRDDLRRSRGTDGATTGDYHVISHEVWRVFLRLYGGGPCIALEESGSPQETNAFNGSSSRTLVTTGSSRVDESTSPRPVQWVITELDEAVVASEFAATNHHQQQQQQQLALRATIATVPSRGESKNKASSARPASTTAIHSSASLTLSSPPILARSTSEKPRHLAQGDALNHRRVSSTFVGYWKKWGRLTEQTTTTASSSSPTKFSQVDDGVVLYDPMEMATAGESAEEDDDVDGEQVLDFSSSRGPGGHQRDTIAAVSAFAVAAAEARRKSTRSLLRHSTGVAPTRSISDSSMMAA